MKISKRVIINIVNHVGYPKSCEFFYDYSKEERKNSLLFDYKQTTFSIHIVN